MHPAADVTTAPLVALGLLGGYLVARETGVRPLGGAVLAAAGGYAARTWVVRDGAATATGLTAVYVAAFGGSHPLARRVGAWPAVLTATAVAAGAAYGVSDRRR